MIDDHRAQWLTSAIADGADDLSDFVAASVAVPSVSGDETAIQAWYTKWFQEQGWEFDTQALQGSILAGTETHVEGRANLIAYPLGRPTSSDRIVVINGHVDVVPSGEASEWKVPPFSGAQIDGRIHGRGTVDMKGGIGSALYALRALRTLHITTAMKPVVHLVIGEETGGVGTRLALHELGAPDAAVVMEPTGNELVTICTGLQFFKLETYGKAAHSSAPWRGVDALQRILPLREALVDIADQRSQRFKHPRYRDMPTAIPFNIGKFTAGSYQASVPDHAEVVGRIGLAPGEIAEEVRQEFQQALARTAREDPNEADLPHSLTWMGEEFPAWETANETPLVKTFSDSLRSIDGEASLKGLTAGSDAGQYGALGVQTVIFGPGEIALAHSSEESVDAFDLIRAAQTLALTLARLT